MNVPRQKLPETGLGSSARTVIGRHEFLLKLSPICTLHISLNFILFTSQLYHNYTYTAINHSMNPNLSLYTDVKTFLSEF